MSVTRTMGVQQVPGGLDVAVMQFSDEGDPLVMYAGRVSGEHRKAVEDLRSVVDTYNVRRALVGPHPDDKLAALLIQEMPSVFALEAGSSHTGASLAEVAYKRIEAMSEPVIAPPPAPAQVAGLAVHPDDPRRVTVSVYVPPGEPLPTHAIIPLEGAEALERPDGARVVEREVGLHEIGVMEAAPVPAQVGWPRQVWSLAATTKLPTKGWTLVVSLYAGNGSLMHEQALTEGQLLGLANLVPSAVSEAASWLNPPTPLPVGPYSAIIEVFAGQASVYSVGVEPTDTDPSSFASLLHDVSLACIAWIEQNAVVVEQQYPGVNVVPPPGPYDIPDITGDTYDYPDAGAPPNPAG